MPTKYTIEDAAPSQTKYTIEDETPPTEQDWRDPLTKVHPHHLPTAEDNATIGSRSRYVGREVGKGFANIGASGLQVLLHPVDTAVGMGKSASDAFDAVTGNPMPMLKNQAVPLVQQLNEHPLETVEQFVGQAGVLDIAGRVAGPVTRGLLGKAARAREGVRTSAQSLTGAGERAVRGQVAAKAKTAGLAAKATEEGNRAVLKAHDQALLDAGQQNVNAHVKWKAAVADTEKANALAQKAVEEVNRAKLKEYETALGEVGRKNLKAHIEYLQKVADTARENATKAKEVEEQNLDESKRYESQLSEAQKANTSAHVKYQSDRAEAEQSNAAARAIPDARAGLETQITEKSAERKKVIDKAEATAKADLDKRFEEQRELLGDEKIPDTYKDGAIVKNALSSLNIGERTIDAYQAFQTNPDPTLPADMKGLQARAGEELGGRELQGIRSKLTSKLTSGKLTGEVYQGYKAALRVIDDGLQKIADNMGVGEQVRKNRADYTHFMRTFHDSIAEPNTVARKTQTATSPDFVRTTEEAQRRTDLDVYDKNIGKLGGEIDSLSGRLSSLPSESTRPKANPPAYPEEKTVEPPNFAKPPEPKPPPEYPEEATMEPPKLNPPAEGKEPPAYPEEKPVAPPKTTPIEVPELSTPELRAELIDKWAKGETGLSKYQVSRLVGSAGIGTLIGAVFGHGFGAEVGSFVAATSYAFGPAVVAKILSTKAVGEWLTRPPVGELEALQKLPYADRIKIVDGINQVARAAKRKGIEVNPAVTALIAASGVPLGPKTKKLEDDATYYRTHSR